MDAQSISSLLKTLAPVFLAVLLRPTPCPSCPACPACPGTGAHWSGTGSTATGGLSWSFGVVLFLAGVLCCLIGVTVLDRSSRVVGTRVTREELVDVPAPRQATGPRQIEDAACGPAIGNAGMGVRPVRRGGPTMAPEAYTGSPGVVGF